MNEECIFIGGPRDGQRIAIPIMKTEVLMSVGMGGTHVKYKELQISPSVRVFMIDSISVEQAIKQLVNGYKPAR